MNSWDEDTKNNSWEIPQQAGSSVRNNTKSDDVEMDFGSGSFVNEIQEAKENEKLKADVIAAKRKNLMTITLTIGAVALVFICYVVFAPRIRDKLSKENRVLNSVNNTEATYVTTDMRENPKFNNIFKDAYKGLSVEAIKTVCNEIPYDEYISNNSNYQEDLIKVTGNVIDIVENELNFLGKYDTVVILDINNNQWNWFVPSGTLKKDDVVIFYGVPYSIEVINNTAVPSLITILCDTLEK